MGIDLLRIAGFDDAPQIHDADAVADVADDVQIVRDEQIRKPQLILKAHQQIQHLRLNGNIQRGNRLIRNDETRARDQGAGDGDALTLTAGELMRIAVELLGRNADRAGNPQHALVQLILRELEVRNQRLLQQLANGHARIQRGIRILKDQLHVAAFLAHGFRVERAEVFTLEVDFAFRRLNQAQNGSAGCGFAAAGFADQAERFFFVNRQGDILDGADIADRFTNDAALDGEIGFQMLDIE